MKVEIALKPNRALAEHQSLPLGALHLIRATKRAALYNQEYHLSL